jgi:hypothetical protein
VVDDLSTLSAFIALVNANQKHIAAFMLILATTYKEEKTRYLKRRLSIRKLFKRRKLRRKDIKTLIEALV